MSRPGTWIASSAQEVLTILSRLNKEFGQDHRNGNARFACARFATKVRYLRKGELLAEGVVRCLEEKHGRAGNSS